MLSAFKEKRTLKFFQDTRQKSKICPGKREHMVTLAGTEEDIRAGRMWNGVGRGMTGAGRLQERWILFPSAAVSLSTFFPQISVSEIIASLGLRRPIACRGGFARVRGCKSSQSPPPTQYSMPNLKFTFKDKNWAFWFEPQDQLSWKSLVLNSITSE